MYKYDQDNRVSMGIGSIILTGDLILPDGHEKCTLGIRNGLIEYVDKGETVRDGDGVIVEGSIYPGLFNMHTHLGDHGARGTLPSSLRETVFPGGLKHGFLENAARDTILSSIRASIRELSAGTTRILDFREGGIGGVKILREAAGDSGPRVYALGRPAGNEDIMDLLEISDGLGMPSLDSCSVGIVELCRKGKKIFSVHASELYREDIDLILDLKPDLLVHMISGTRDDWRMLGDMGIPVAVCPRANRAFSLDVPLPAMMEEGVMLGLGSDNALSVRQDMFREMEEAWMLLRRSGMEGKEAAARVFRMAAGSTLLGSSMIGKLPHAGTIWGSGWPRIGDEAHLMVLGTETDHMPADPISHIVRFSSSRDVIWTGPR